MVTWSINLNGKPYSTFYSNLRSAKHAEKVVAEWRARWDMMGSGIPAGELTASVYHGSALDNYGVKRNG